ncbi:MAG: ATP-binding protein [Thermoleophilia bacterium]
MTAALIVAVIALAALCAALLVTRKRTTPVVDEVAPPVVREPVPTVAAGDAFELLPVAGVEVGGDLRIAHINAAFRGRFPHVHEGQLLLEGFGEHRLVEQVAGAMVGGQPVDFEVRLFTDDRRTYRVRVAPVAGDGGAPHALVFLTDLTDAIEYQELRSQFVANVSHELRTPITGLRGLLEALDDEDIDTATRRRFAGRAIAETQRLEALIADILFLSELEAAPAGGAGQATDLRTAAGTAVDALAALIDEVNADVQITVPEVPVLVPLTDRMAATVAQNLLQNALKYGGAHVRVTVAVERDPDEGVARLSVSDDGPGISERHLPHIFERFFRADPSRSKRMGGTGLGLSIVKHIAEHVGGQATATSREGFGATVGVAFPLEQSHQPAETQHAPAPRHRSEASG